MIFHSKLILFTACVISRMITVDAVINIYNQDKEKVASFKDKEAEIGEILIESIQGYIEVANPPDACVKIVKPTILSNFSIGKFILINGTEKCSYMIKVKNVQRAGFDIAIVFDPFPKPYHDNHTIPFPMPQMKIPLLFISYEDGIALRDKYKYNRRFANNYIVEMVPNNSQMSQTTFILIVVIAVFFVLILLLAIIIICVLYLNKRCRIITDCFSREHKYENCVICRENYNIGDELAKLFCQHIYHPHCIYRWIDEGKDTCPSCRRKVCPKQYRQLPPNDRTPLLLSSANRAWGTSHLGYMSNLPGTSYFRQTVPMQYSNHSRIEEALGSEMNPSRTSRQNVDLSDVLMRSLTSDQEYDHHYLNKEDFY